jgi:hypothetical protein
LKNYIFFSSRDRNGEDFLVPASPRPEKIFPASSRPATTFYFAPPPRPKKSSPRLTPPRFFKVFLLTVLTPKAAMEKIFYSPPRPAPKKVFPASPRAASSFYFSSPPRPAPPKVCPAPIPRRVSTPRFGLCSVLLRC